MPTFAVSLHFVVTGPDGVRREHADRVFDGYAAVQDAAAHLLGSSWSYAERPGHAQVEVELTVEAPDKALAFERGCAGVWWAIQDAGGLTLGTAEPARGPAPVVYRMAGESVQLVRA